MRVDVEKDNRQREVILMSLGCLARVAIIFIIWVAVLYVTFAFVAANMH